MNLGAIAVFERGNDAAPVGVVLRVGGGDDEHIQGHTDAVALDLDIAFLHQVEQADLDALGQVGEFVDAENAAVGAGDEAVVDGGFVGEVAAFGNLDGVDFADEVGDGDVGGGQFFGIAEVAAKPGNGGVVSHFGDDADSVGADGMEGVVVEFAAGNDGDLFVQQVDQGADEAGFGLAPFAQQDDVLAGEDGVFQLGNDGVVEADDAGEYGFLGADFGNQVVADFGADGDGLIAAGAEFAAGGGQGVSRHWASPLVRRVRCGAILWCNEGWVGAV